MPYATKSALQDAREAFIAGLARRADALRPVVETFIADPGTAVVRAELQRRLHSLLASAQLFEEPALVAHLQRLTNRLDEVGLDAEAWQQPDSDLLLSLLASLSPPASRAKESGVAPAPGRAPSSSGSTESPLRSGRHHVGVANDTSVRPPEVAQRPANRPPGPVQNQQLLTRVLLVCSRPHAAELRSLLDDAPLELLHAADPEQALRLLERAKPSYALIAAEFATLPDIDLVTRLRHDLHQPVEGVYLMLPNGATYDVDFVRQTGADGVLIEPISWEMLGPLLDRGGSPEAVEPPPPVKLSLEDGLTAAFEQAQSAIEAHPHVFESARVPKAAPAATSVLAQVQAARAAAEAAARSAGLLKERVAADNGKVAQPASAEARGAGAEAAASAQSEAAESGARIAQTETRDAGAASGAVEARGAAESAAAERGAVEARVAAPSPVVERGAADVRVAAAVVRDAAEARAADARVATEALRPVTVDSTAKARAAAVSGALEGGAEARRATESEALSALAEATAESGATEARSERAESDAESTAAEPAAASSAEEQESAAAASGASKVLPQIEAARAMIAASGLPEVQNARATVAELAALSGAPSVLAQVQAARASLAEQMTSAPTVSADKSPEAGRSRPLIGRRVLIVDDDPAMLWFFSGVVRDAGGEALQARDGAEGLEMARRKRPQLVLSDILMPKLDGFALRRTLARDLYLERTPVVLLSWKGDPAEDTEASTSNASGLLRKEASVAEVLAAITRALSPRQQLEQALRAEGDVSGQVDALGIVALIECIVAARPDVRLTVEDASDLFEVAIADANQIAVTRTAADGTFTRGERALLQLIGLSHGRFHVSKRTTGLRSPVQTPLKAALHAAVSELSALIDAVSSERIAQVARVAFDEDALASRLPDTPAIQPIVAALREHQLSPAQLLDEGTFSAGELAACLMPLARQAVITSLWSADGKDLLADITRLHMPRPASPPAPPELSALPAPPPKAAAPKAPVSEPEAVEEAPPSLAAEEAPAIIEAAPLSPPPAKPIEPESDFESDPEADFELHTNPALIAEITAARRRRRDGLILLSTLAASCVLGYIGALQLEAHPGLFGSPDSAGARAADQPLMAATTTSETSVRSGLDANSGLGTVLPYIDTTRGVPVGNDEGLVIFEYVGPLPTPNVEIDGRVLGSPPLAVALSASPHQLKLWFAGQPTTRTLSVRAGETRVITLPLSKP